MNLQSQEWKDEVQQKSFVPESAEAGLVEETVRRLAHVFDLSETERTVREIVTVALFDAQDMIINRMDS